MLRVLTEKIGICFAGFLLLVACTACKAGAPSYSTADYLNDLSEVSGIGTGEEYRDKLDELKDWGIVEDGDKALDDEKLSYDYLKTTVSRLMDDEKGLDTLIAEGKVDESIRNKKTIEKEDASKVIKEAVDHINSREYEENFTAIYTRELKSEDDVLYAGDLLFADGEYLIVTEVRDEGCVCRPAEFEEVFTYFDLSDTYDIDFTQAEVIPYGEESDDIAYVNENYTLLSQNNNHVFNTDGFRISYTLNRSGVDVHVSKEVNGMNVYGDLSINNVKPTFKWTYKEDDLKNCFFRISFNSTEKVGCSTGKYGNYHLKFRDLDSSTFASLLRSIVEPASDEVEATLPICQIRTPIPNVPTAFLNLNVVLKLYVSGKTELQLYNSNALGFETKNGHIRFINDNSHDYDAILQASAKAAVGLNMALEAATFRLADVETDGGIRGVVKTTMHLYDEDGNMSSSATDIAYSTLEEISQENPDVKICGDVSFYWMLDLIINTSKTKMSKLGFTKTFHILDDDNQVFGNLHHIEDGHFVKSCTRKNREAVKTMDNVVSNRIVLNSYAEVLKEGETYQIFVKALPQDYSEAGLIYSSSESSIAEVSADGLVKALTPGSARIKVATTDGKYESYVNILVSTG